MESTRIKKYIKYFASFPAYPIFKRKGDIVQMIGDEEFENG